MIKVLEIQRQPLTDGAQVIKYLVECRENLQHEQICEILAMLEKNLVRCSVTKQSKTGDNYTYECESVSHGGKKLV